MLIVAVAAAVTMTVADAEAQTGSAAPVAGPEIEQVRLTAPVKPPNGVTVIATEAEAPGLGSTKLAGPLTPMLGVGTPLTYTATPLDVDEL